MSRPRTRVSRPRSEAFLRHPLTQLGSGYAIVLLLVYNYVLLRTAASFSWNDFGKFYYATLNWRSGLSMYAPTVATSLPVSTGLRLQFLDMNPPHFHLLLLPLVTLPIGTAARVWLVLNAVSALTAIVMVVRELKLRVPIWQWMPLAVIGLLSVATNSNAVTAQCTGVLMLPMTAAWLAARRQQWVTCGVWLGVVIGVKPFLGLFLPVLALRGQWRATVSACLAGLVSSAVGVAVFGWSSYVEWIGALRSVSWVWGFMNGSIQALLARSLAPSPAFTPAVAASWLIIPVWIIGSAVVAVVSYRATTRSLDHMFSVTILAALLISPLGWTYYLWLAMPSLLSLWRTGPSWPTWVGLALLCVPLPLGTFGQPYWLATVTLASAYSWGLLFLWLGLVMRPQSEAASAISTDASEWDTPSRQPRGVQADAFVLQRESNHR